MFAVYDWAGNRLHFYGTFDDFETAWGAIREHIPDESYWQEFEVREL